TNSSFLLKYISIIFLLDISNLLFLFNETLYYIPMTMNRCQQSILMLSFLLIGNFLFSQTASLSGKVTSNNKPLDFVNIHLQGTELGSTTDGSGVYRIEEIPFGTYRVIVSSIGYGSQTKTVALKAGDALVLNFGLIRENSELGEVVITGTMKEVSKLESPVP